MLGGIYFMEKWMTKFEIFIWLPLDQHVWDVLVPKGDLRSKNGIKQNVLGIPF